MNKKVAVLQSNYIPWKGYFDMINRVDEFIVYDDVQYTKNDWRNRNRIKTPLGCQWITIPVRQQYLEQKINETRVSADNWAEKHWRTLVGNYSKAACFKNYSTEFERIYYSMRSRLLSEINVVFIKTICRILGIQTKISLSSDYRLIDGKNERLVDLIKQAEATEYISGPAAKSYLNLDLYKEAGIVVTWMDYSGYKDYPQLFPPFDHSVTILDLIFNTGDDARSYMKSF